MRGMTRASIDAPIDPSAEPRELYTYEVIAKADTRRDPAQCADDSLTLTLANSVGRADTTVIAIKVSGADDTLQAAGSSIRH